MNFTQLASRIGFLAIMLLSVVPLHSQTDLLKKSLRSTLASGETVTVTTVADVVDFSGSRQVSDLPGPDGRVSFREAVTAVNNTSGPQTIAFAIPVSEFWLITNTALLKVERGPFFLEDDATTVDFSTQTANIGDTNANGPDIGMYGLEPNGWGVAAIYMKGNNGVIRGLGDVYQRGYALRIVGDNNRVISCDIQGPLHAAIMIAGYSNTSPASGNVIGGTATGEGNILSGIRINGPSDQTTILGNLVTSGVYVHGSSQSGVSVNNTRIGGPTAGERNVIAGNGFFSSEGYPVGQQISVVDAGETVVEGNYIGTTVNGMAPYPQQIGAIGIEVRDSRSTTVRGNLIAGLRTVGRNHYAGQVFGQAVFIGATNMSTYDTLVEGNTIGLAADGVTTIVTRSGVTVEPLTGNYHAFGTRIAGNHIAGVETKGVTIGSQENGVTITRNKIHDSGLLGIDLLHNFNDIGGVTINDLGDGDVGGNGLQNFPVVMSAVTTGSSVTFDGTLDSVPSEQFTVEFFASPACDPSGYGEGAVFLGSAFVSTDAAGHAEFSSSQPGTVPAGWAATTTATRLSTGDRSEFSACAMFTQASGLSISGRVLTPEGRAIRDATVTITNSQGASWTAALFARGNYQFTGMVSGERYTINVDSGRYWFPQQKMMLSGTLTNMDFVGTPKRRSGR